MQQFTVRFFRDKLQEGFKSEAEGHPVFRDVDFVEIRIPGDTNNIIVREATDKDKAQHAALYAAYKAGLEPSVDGTPLEAWPRLTPAQVANYKALGFKTVEQIANMSDTVLGKIGMGAQADRTAACAYLNLAKDSALAQKQALELERRDRRIADLENQVKQLASRMDKSKA